MKNSSVSQPSRTLRLAAYFVALPLLLCLGASTEVRAQTLTTLDNFNGSNGAFPSTALAKTHRWFQHSNGNFYGTAPFGGANEEGTVFQVAPVSGGGSGKITVIYSFCSIGGNTCLDGAVPEAALVEGSDGNLYGSTELGGANNDGTIFKITTKGVLTTLHTFSGTDGANPVGGLTIGSNGNLFGTTYAGGANNDGTVFEITCSGTLTTLHSFSGADGANPEGDLLPAGWDGNLYGATLAGGNSTGSGTLFKITPSGTFTTLYDFCSKTGCTDGAQPRVPFTQDQWGNFYGTTTYTGANAGGTVFQYISGANVLHTLYHFCSKGGSACTDGQYPISGPVIGIDGNIYGTTYGGGANAAGTIYQLTPWSVLNTLYNFCSKGGSACTDGAFPEASLIQGTDQNFYGTTSFGGTYNLGTYYNLNTIPPDGGSCNGVYSGQYWGNITVAAGQTCEFTDGGQIWGNVYVTGGNLILNNASVMGNVNIEGGGTYTLGPALSIMSTLDIENIPSGTAQNSICGVTVNGGLQVDANATAVQIGSSSGSCAGNTIGGDLEILSNSALVQTFNNKVGNNLVCTGNNSVSGGGNTARQKQTQCSSF